MQRAARRHAGPPDIAGIWRNLRAIQHHVEHRDQPLPGSARSIRDGERAHLSGRAVGGHARPRLAGGHGSVDGVRLLHAVARAPGREGLAVT